MQYVDPIPDGERSTATVYLEDDGLPALRHWDDQFRRMVHQTYQLRGVEVTLAGTIEARNNRFRAAQAEAPDLQLSWFPLTRKRKIKWDPAAQGPQAAEPAEASAYDTLTRSAGAVGARPLAVTGPLHQTQAGYRLQVRLEARPDQGSWALYPIRQPARPGESPHGLARIPGTAVQPSATQACYRRQEIVDTQIFCQP